MANAAITSTPGEWKLTGITKGEGQCECCSRALTQRVFEVSHPAHGAVALGRRCAAKATGYKPNAVERAAAAAARWAELETRRAVVAAAYPAMDVNGHVLSTAVTTDCWWGGRGWAAYSTWAEYVDTCTARA
jgi:hypothetical protein